MFTISEIEDNLDKTMNYINALKFYWEKEVDREEDTEEIEDVLKCIVLSIENLDYILKSLAKLHSSYESNENLGKVLETLKDSYILSDKCIKKIIFLNKCYEDILNRKTVRKIISDLYKIIEYLDDTVDEIFDYIDF